MFEHFLGRKQCDGYDDPLTREACRLWLERVLGYYGDDPASVDIGIIEGQLPLTAATAEYIYHEFTPTIIDRRGDRPMLDAVVDSVVRPGMSDRDKAMALMRRCRDNRKLSSLRSSPDFCGGSEEELIKRGAIMCNEISRVFACLAQIAGLPARIYSAHITGHMMNEVLVDGRWWWVDVMFGIYCFRDDDTPASAWDLLQDPTLFNRQKRATFNDHFNQTNGPFPTGHPRRDELNLAYRIARYRECYFNPKEAAAIGNYSVNDCRRFTAPWYDQSADPAREAVARHRLAQVTRKLGWPDWYWDFKLFDEQLKTRD